MVEPHNYRTTHACGAADPVALSFYSPHFSVKGTPSLRSSCARVTSNSKGSAPSPRSVTSLYQSSQGRGALVIDRGRGCPRHQGRASCG
jgi:hypothetical protein